MNNVLLAWLTTLLAIVSMLAVFAGLLEWRKEIARWCGRVVNSEGFISVIVVVTAVLPVIGVVTAFWTGEWRWLALCLPILLFLS